MEPPVDFAIITALKVEREAVVRRLTDLTKVQIDGEPLTYYTGTVAVPGDAQAYAVVVVQLIDMGNNDAAIATTQVLNHWKPRNVLMVGIAGGLKGKVRLGDVVVARHSCYYELAKLKPGDTEYRPKQFHADQMLLARAMHYEEADWKSHIEVGRPGDEADLPIPDVHVEPIACGEKVVADLEALANIARVCPKMVALAMEGAGAGRAVSSIDRPPRYLEIRGISDYAGPDKNDGWHEYAANAAAAFAIGFLKSRPVVPGPPPEDRGAVESAAPTLVLSVQSLRTIDAAEVLPALVPAERRGELEFLPIDLTDLAVSRAIRDPEEAARRIAGSHGTLLAALARRTDARLVFHGLASIPPVILAGHVVSDRRPVSLLDYHPELSSWAWPDAVADIPPLVATGVPKRPVKEPCEVVIRVSVTAVDGVAKMLRSLWHRVRRVYVTVSTEQAPPVDARAVKARVEAALAEGGLTVVEPVPGVPDQVEGHVSVSMGANVLPDGTAVLRSDMALVRSVVAMGPAGPVRGDAPVWLDLSDSTGDGRDLKAQAVRMAESQAKRLARDVARVSLHKAE